MIGSDFGDPGGSTRRRLDLACSLANVLLARSTVDRDGLALLDELALPTAMITTGATAPQVANAAWRRAFGAASPVQLAAHIDEVARTGKTVHVPSLALDERMAYFAVTLRPVSDSVIVVCAPITDELVARSLGVSRETLVWGGPAGSAADYSNAAWRTYTGASSADAWREQIRASDLPSCHAAMPGTECDARIRRADGVDRWHHVAFAISDARWFAIATDVDDILVEAARRDMLANERTARLEAEQAGHRKDQFFATLSHELRSPLTTMLLWERVLQDAGDAAVRAQALEAIHQSVMSQSRVIGDLLDVARAISGKLHVDLRIVDVELVLRSAIAAIEPAASAKQITVERRGEVTAAQVQGDDTRLRQVFDNLLSNAVKFTNPGGRIRIGSTPTDGSIAIEIADNGRGIAAEFLPHLFEPFSQTDDMLTRRAGGLGLGLTIANQLVALHRGTLAASSPGPDHGATFTVTLPVAMGRSTAAFQSVTRTRKLDRVRVLVVDDDRRVRDALALLLDRVGAVVDTAESADAARHQIAAHMPEAVVCDIAMPGEDGYTFIRQLRASGGEVPAIALTAHATESDARTALAAGFDVHLAKPIDFECLVENIDELIHGRVGAR